MIKKSILALLFLIPVFAFANGTTTQTAPNSPPSNQLMYPEYPADDQPEPRIPNSLVLRKFNDALFEKAQKEGKLTLLVFSKSDCPGCTAQVPTLLKVLKDSTFQGIEVFQIDFINQPDLNQRFNVRGWTHLLAYKSGREIKRSAGQKSPSQIRNFLKEAFFNNK